MTDKSQDTPSHSFEEAYSRLDEIARLLEDETTSLERSFSLYEEGQKLLKKCQAMLDEAEKKLRIIQVSDNNDIVEIKEERIE